MNIAWAILILLVKLCTQFRIFFFEVNIRNCSFEVFVDMHQWCGTFISTIYLGMKIFI